MTTQLTAIPQSLEQAQDVARRAGEILRAGGLVVFPTETVYGVAASAASERGLAALREVKGRPETQPFTLHIPTPESAEKYVDVGSSPLLRRLVRKVFPGPVTLVVDAPDAVIAEKLRGLGLPAEAREHIYSNNTVGLRCPDHELGQMVLEAAGEPIVASSANRRGEAPTLDADDAARAVGEAVDLVVDGGRCRYSKPSTIVRVRGTGRDVQVSVEREGVYDERFIQKLLRFTMLVVCSGNTCRSPMAEGLARQMLAEARGVSPEELECSGVRVVSAGAFAQPGMPASPQGVEAMRRFGVDLSGHRSRTLSPELIHEADVIFCMTEGHRRAVLAMVPAAAHKTLLLDPSGDIEDPIGADLTTYQRCAEVIRRKLEHRIREAEV